MNQRVDDIRIKSVRPLLPAAILIEEIPASAKSKKTVFQGRSDVESAISGTEDRLVVIVGPCSIHDPIAALDYAHQLKQVQETVQKDLVIVMRTYFEKPRTTIGWKGLVNDPYLDGSYRVNEGLRIARRLLHDVTELGLPCATEFLDTSFPQHLADMISWGAIGARTTESQVHRELASGLSMPIGFKNATDGGIQVAVDAILASKSSHWFAGATKDGVSALIQTSGNEFCHLILRGGLQTGPNYEADRVQSASESLKKQGLNSKLMVDLSHGNSMKDHRRQLESGASVADQVASGSTAIMGVMIESFLIEGKQNLGSIKSLVYGQSVTDGCLSFQQTVPLLDLLAHSVRERRLKS